MRNADYISEARAQLGPCKSTSWTVYGILRTEPYCATTSITKVFTVEEDAMAYITTKMLMVRPDQTVHAVVVRVDKHCITQHMRDGLGGGKYKDVCTVTLRIGEGRGWWE